VQPLLQSQKEQSQKEQSQKEQSQKKGQPLLPLPLVLSLSLLRHPPQKQKKLLPEPAQNSKPSVAQFPC
jgi:hypothetical protein